MEIIVIKAEKNELRFEVKDESHTLLNLLQNVLLEDRTVDFAGYDIPHPLVSRAVFYVRMKGDGSPQKAIDRALEKIRDEMNLFSKKFDAAGAPSR